MHGRMKGIPINYFSICTCETRLWRANQRFTWKILEKMLSARKQRLWQIVAEQSVDDGMYDVARAISYHTCISVPKVTHKRRLEMAMDKNLNHGWGDDDHHPNYNPHCATVHRGAAARIDS